MTSRLFLKTTPVDTHGTPHGICGLPQRFFEFGYRFASGRKNPAPRTWCGVVRTVRKSRHTTRIKPFPVGHCPPSPAQLPCFASPSSYPSDPTPARRSGLLSEVYSHPPSAPDGDSGCLSCLRYGVQVSLLHRCRLRFSSRRVSNQRGAHPLLRISVVYICKPLMAVV
jgi:hypothetical protein